jgi:hypothetical protein
MKKIMFSVGAVLLLASFSVQPFNANLPGKEKMVSIIKSGRGYTAQLSGTEEPTGGDPDGTGRAYLEFNPGKGTLYYYLEVHNIEPATAAHVHFGAAGVAGGIIAELEPPTDGVSYGTIDLDKATIQAIKKNPQDYYVNVHNAEYPGGAVRGQIVN